MRVEYMGVQEAVDAIVAVNHATGLRFLYNEDLTVGLWVSAMHLKYLTGDDIGITIHPWGYEDDFVQVCMTSLNLLKTALVPLLP